MAKCVKRVEEIEGQQNVLRLPESLAHRAVASGQWHYTSKGAWKSAGRPPLTKALPGIIAVQ